MFCTSQSICCLQKHQVYQCLPAWGPPVVCRQAALFLSLHCLVQLSFCFVTSPWSKNEQNCCQGDITVTVNHGSCRAPPRHPHRHPHNRASQAAQKDWWGLVTPWYGATCWGVTQMAKSRIIKKHRPHPGMPEEKWARTFKLQAGISFLLVFPNDICVSISINMYIYIYVYIYMYVYMYVYIYISWFTSSSPSIDLCVCASVCLSVCLPACPHVCMCVYMHMHMCMCTYVLTSVCLCVYLCVRLQVRRSVPLYACTSARLHVCINVSVYQSVNVSMRMDSATNECEWSLAAKRNTGCTDHCYLVVTASVASGMGIRQFRTNTSCHVCPRMPRDTAQSLQQHRSDLDHKGGHSMEKQIAAQRTDGPKIVRMDGWMGKWRIHQQHQPYAGS